MSCECGWEIDAPARSPWFLKIRMYLNRLSRIRSRYRCLYEVMISCTWNSLCRDRWCSCYGVSTMTSCAPTPFTLWNSWVTWRWTSPSTCRAGYLFVFFFQAEDGIRDLTVTGVQTCALPI